MESNNSLERLLESLIKMVGKANQKVDSLQVRVSQLEWIIKEQEIMPKERDPVTMYPAHTSSEPH